MTREVGHGTDRGAFRKFNPCWDGTWSERMQEMGIGFSLKETAPAIRKNTAGAAPHQRSSAGSPTLFECS